MKECLMYERKIESKRRRVLINKNGLLWKPAGIDHDDYCAAIVPDAVRRRTTDQMSPKPKPTKSTPAKPSIQRQSFR